MWRLYTQRKLRYKFSALRNGVELNKKTPKQLFNLRRNTHRIEKGLSYPTVKRRFALAYIYETVNTLFELKNTNALDQATENWSISVLKEYFRKTDLEEETIKKAKALFDEIATNDTEKYEYYPYEIADRHESNLSFEALFDLSLQRRSIRYFQKRKIERATLDKAFEIAKLAPSACNRQAFNYLYFDDKAVVDRLAKIPGGVSGYELHNVIVLVGNYAGYFDERDINAPIIDASLSAMSFLYACETLGLGAVCINWPNLPDREQNIRKVINLEDSEFVIMLIGVGYPADKGKIAYSKKRSNKGFLEINKRTKS